MIKIMNFILYIYFYFRQNLNIIIKLDSLNLFIMTVNKNQKLDNDINNQAY